VIQWRPPEAYDVWRNRAAFHFLSQQSQRDAYIWRLKAALRRGGRVNIGTFALDSPEKCSGSPLRATALRALARFGFRLRADR